MRLINELAISFKPDLWGVTFLLNKTPVWVYIQELLHIWTFSESFRGLCVIHQESAHQTHKETSNQNVGMQA